MSFYLVLLLFLATNDSFVHSFVIPSSSSASLSFLKSKKRTPTNQRNHPANQRCVLKAYIDTNNGSSSKRIPGSTTPATTINRSFHNNYIRFEKAPSTNNNTNVDAWEMQTAITTFERKNTVTNQIDRIELHAQIHFAEEDTNYFQYYNTKQFTNKYDTVFYELLLDEELLLPLPPNTAKPSSLPSRILKADTDLMASINDQNIANQYGWNCQVNEINYKQNNWIHADYTRQQFLESIQEKERQQQRKKKKKNNKDMPLWEQALSRTSSSSLLQPVLEPTVSALLVGPAMAGGGSGTSDVMNNIVTSMNNKNRRLFSNLFLPGNSLAFVLRVLLWLTVPSPEISILLLDWSCIFQSSTIFNNNDYKKQTNKNGSPENDNIIIGLINKLTTPILQCLITGNIQQVRQLIFGQILLAGQEQQLQKQQENDDPALSLLITERNDYALQILQSYLDTTDDETTPGKRKSTSSALLYGCSHCPDLHSKLISNGFIPIKKEWRTAWSIPVPSAFTSTATSTTTHDIDNHMDETPNKRISTPLSPPPPSSSSLLSSTTLTAAILVVVPIYLLIGGADYISTLKDLIVALEGGSSMNSVDEFFIIYGFYILRHVVLYLGLSKFILDV